ncbi:MAG TPA: signal peptidase II [Gemmatimonadaceae bacterium]|nr:signal peptidase II [Gemmatimonadaceae bacterium]
MSSSARNGRVFWTAAVVVIVLDVITKFLAVRYLMPQHVPHPIVGEFVRFTLAFNPGAAFSMSLGDNSRYIFGAFAVVALYILWRLYRTSVPGDTLRVLALGLACGGAAGNLIDRFRGARGVVDFIDIGVGDVRFWTFNVADSAVTVGAIVLAFVLWREDRRELAEQAAQAAARDEVSSRAQ